MKNRVQVLVAADHPTLHPLAVQAGNVCARRIFNTRGNHSEVHLNEFELALFAAAAAQIALERSKQDATK